MFARAFLIVEDRTGAIRGNPALNVNRVGVFVWLLMRGVDHLNITILE
jgi:hypothetical protein